MVFYDFGRIRGRLNVSQKNNDSGHLQTPDTQSNDDDACSQTLGEGRGGVTGVMSPYVTNPMLLK